MRRIPNIYLEQSVSDITVLYEENSFQDGVKQGLEKGMDRGLEQGLEIGIEEGMLKGKKEVADALLKEGFDILFVQKVTGLSAEQLKSYKST